MNPSEQKVQRVVLVGLQEPPHYLAHLTQLLSDILRAYPFLYSLQTALLVESQTAQLKAQERTQEFVSRVYPLKQAEQCGSSIFGSRPAFLA